MSTGMQTIETLRASVAILNASGVDYALLECTNLYPSPPEIVSLAGVKELEGRIPECPHRILDHSIGPQMALASVALGACILERHFRQPLPEGPDISCSMDPAELRFLIDRSKEIHHRTPQPEAAHGARRGRLPVRPSIHRRRSRHGGRDGHH